MSTRQRALASLLVLICLVPGLAFAARRGRLVGKVTDEQRKPIQGVRVTVTSPEDPDFKDIETTDKKGVFSVDFDKVDVTYHFRFDAPGFQSIEQDQKWELEGSQFYEWTMKAGESAAPSATAGPPPASTSREAIHAYNAGLTAYKSKDYAPAEAKFKEAVEADPKLRQAWESLSLVEFALKHDQEAADAAEKAVALGSADPAVLQTRWQAYRNLKDDAKTAEALKDLDRVGRRTEEAKKVHNEAVALMKSKDYAGAFAKFQEALQVDPNLQPSLLGLAESGVKIGKNEEAATAAEKVLEADPTNAQAIRLRYNACLALGDEKRLAEALAGLGAVEPAVARNGLLKLAFDAYDKNDLVKAKDYFDKVLAVDANTPLAHYYLGLIDVNQGAIPEAKSHLERFLQLAPNDPQARDAREMLDYLNKR